MYKEIIVTKEVSKRLYFCDICGVKIPFRLSCTDAHCQICQKDLCENCIGTEKDTPGDYREVWCKNCWTIGEKYRPKIKEFDDKVKKLYDAWYKEC